MWEKRIVRDSSVGLLDFPSGEFPSVVIINQKCNINLASLSLSYFGFPMAPKRFPGKNNDFDREAFYRDLIPHLPSLYNFARWMTLNKDDAEDFVHDAISSVVTKRNVYFPGTNLRQFLITVMRRIFINRVRRMRYEVSSNGYPENEESIPSGKDSEISHRFSGNMVRLDLLRALQCLSEEQQMIIFLADIEEYSLREIGEVMSMPVGTVKSKLWRARAALRERLVAY